ncbi:MAG: hypothetical protein HY551_02675 [Elusimicrobia bacterium]|nr:hypothetical protein [Elusimicrobiota bacterium]
MKQMILSVCGIFLFLGSSAAQSDKGSSEKPMPAATSVAAPAETPAAMSVDMPAAASAEPKAAQGAQWGSFRSWLRNLKEGLSKSAVERHYQRRNVVAVAAVRGAGQKSEDINKPYVKDPVKYKAAQRLRREKAEFAEAVDLLLSGKMEEGVKRLEEFEAKNPKSSLLPDVRETRGKARELMALKDSKSPEGAPPSDASVPEASPGAPPASLEQK